MVKLEGLHVVTGAFGYTGRWIAHKLLEKGEKVRTLTNAIGRDDPFDGQVEIRGLMRGLVASKEEPRGTIKFSEWVAEKGNEIGRHYHNDLKERRYSK